MFFVKNNYLFETSYNSISFIKIYYLDTAINRFKKNAIFLYIIYIMLLISTDIMGNHYYFSN